MSGLNAAQRVIECQQAQRTNLGCGIDAHYEPDGVLGFEFYERYATPDLCERIRGVVRAYASANIGKIADEQKLVTFLAGVAGYYRSWFEAAFKAGIRVLKPQSSFFERFMQFGPIVELLVLERIRGLIRDRDDVFLVRDCKREDLALTMRVYFDNVLAGPETEVIPGLCGQLDYDTMTITGWMGEDVLMPGLEYFEGGKGAIVVTRSSNSSGTTLQDMLACANADVQLAEHQEPFRVTAQEIDRVADRIGRPPMNHEILLARTEDFSTRNGLGVCGTSPIFSVMGATALMDGAFRLIRQTGLALGPGFGGQKGKYENVMQLFWNDGPYAGHGVLCMSSRAHNHPWMKKYGAKEDDPNPANLAGHVARAIDEFRRLEKREHEAAGLHYPFAA